MSSFALEAREAVGFWNTAFLDRTSPEKKVYTLGRQLFREENYATNEARQVRSRVVASPTELIDPQFMAILKLIDTTQIPQRWTEEGSEQPLIPCRGRARSVLGHIYSAFSMLPIRVSASRVGGIMLVYRDDKSARELEIEIDNELDVVAVISTEHDVLESAALESPHEWRQFARKFREAA